MTTLVILLSAFALLGIVDMCVAAGWCADTRDPEWTAGPLLDRPHATSGSVR